MTPTVTDGAPGPGRAALLLHLLPGLLIAAYFLVGLALYALKAHPDRDADLEQRGPSALLGMRIRNYFAWVMRPISHLLFAAALPPVAITTLSALVATAAAVAVAGGRLALGGWLFVGSGILDFFDGRLARSTGSASRGGAALDSVLDRYADSLFALGLAWHFRASWVLIAVGGLLLGSELVSYTRARGEGLGVDVKVGLMQRPERVLYLGLAVALSPVLDAIVVGAAPPQMLAIVGVIVVAIATLGTAVQRLRYLLRVLHGDEESSSASSTTRAVFASAAVLAAELTVLYALVERSALPVWLAAAVAHGFAWLLQLGLRYWPGPELKAHREWYRRQLIACVVAASLVAGGVSLLVALPVDYRLGWLIVRGAVLLGWSLPLQRGYLRLDTHDAAIVDQRPSRGPAKQVLRWH